MPKPLSLLITSIGNPSAQYAHTLHSAGHTLLQHLQTLLPKYDPWSPHLGGQISRPPSSINGRFGVTGFKNVAEDYPTLWMSGSYMNVSGPAVKRAWEGWKNGREDVMLVVVHDELEREVGKVGVKLDGKSSAKGHNGIKSLQTSFARTSFVKIGVGIGRPESRDSKVVADYVLRKMKPWEKEKIEDAAGLVLSIVNDIQYGTYKR